MTLTPQLPGALRRSSVSQSPRPASPAIGKHGREITHAGVDRFGFDSRVPIDLLRSLYLGSPEESEAVRRGADERQRRRSSARSALLNGAGEKEQEEGRSPYPEWPEQTFVAYPRSKAYPPVKMLPPHQRERIVVSGGAGFVGSHLVDRLMLLGHEVIVLDNFFTGSKTNLAHWAGHPNFEMVRHDVTEPFMAECTQIYHLACPASPPHYQYNAVKTIKTSFLGTLNMLGLAKRTKARFLMASTSEIYGDPLVHPQPETYNGNVNPIGPRACYDEGKRVAECLTYGFARQDGVDVRVARIFNTFGPRMNPHDGRVVSNFIVQALREEDMTVYGDGAQTRSFQYIHDLVDGLVLLMNGSETQPVNLGNQDEFTIEEFAKAVRDIVERVLKEEDEEEGTARRTGLGLSFSSGDLKKALENVVEDGGGEEKEEKLQEGEKKPRRRRRVDIVYRPVPVDDPQRRRPDTTRAKETLGWQPQWTVEMGVEEMVRYYKAKMDEGSL